MATLISFDSLTLAQLVALYNRTAPTPVKKFSTKPLAIARCQRLAAERNLVLVLDATDTPALVAAVEEPAEEPAPTLVVEAEVLEYRKTRADFAEGAVIRLVSVPPAKPGSHRAARAAVLRDGMRVAEYLDAAFAAHGGGRARHRFNSDLRRYVAAGHVTVEGA
jgi:NADPH-dependent ferric siderophore reductase